MAEFILADLGLAGIYRIRNRINGKSYIGSAVCFRNRWTSHRHGLSRGCHHSRHLQNAWNKHGEQAFSFEVLQVCSVHELIPSEQIWLDTERPEYNISEIAGSCLGVKHPLATRLKRSELNIGNKFAAGRKVSDQARKAVAESNRKRKGSKRPRDVVESVAAKHRGAKRSEETRRRISDAMKGKKRKPYTEKTIALLRAANIGKGSLSAEDVRTIRARTQDGHKRSALANEYGVSVSMISMIISRKRYAWVED